MAEDIVENVRLLQIVNLVRLADEAPDRELPVGEMGEEGLVGYEARHGDQLPSGKGFQLRVDLPEIRDFCIVEAERVQPVIEFPDRPVAQHACLAVIEPVPHGMLFIGIFVPALVDRVIIAYLTGLDLPLDDRIRGGDA